MFQAAAGSCFCCCKGQVLVSVNLVHAAPAVEGPAAVYVHHQLVQSRLNVAASQDAAATLSSVSRMAGKPYGLDYFHHYGQERAGSVTPVRSLDITSNCGTVICYAKRLSSCVQALTNPSRNPLFTTHSSA
jgi:hypothetical protein